MQNNQKLNMQNNKMIVLNDGIRIEKFNEVMYLGIFLNKKLSLKKLILII